jgi:hypothetical protein
MRVLPIGASRNGRSKVVPRTVVRRSARGTTTPLRGRSRMVSKTAVLAQRHLRVGAAVDVVEHHARKAPFREPPQVRDVHDVMRGQPSMSVVSLKTAAAGSRSPRRAARGMIG